MHDAGFATGTTGTPGTDTPTGIDTTSFVPSNDSRVVPSGRLSPRISPGVVDEDLESVAEVLVVAAVLDAELQGGGLDGAAHARFDLGRCRGDGGEEVGLQVERACPAVLNVERPGHASRPFGERAPRLEPRPERGGEEEARQPRGAQHALFAHVGLTPST